MSSRSPKLSTCPSVAACCMETSGREVGAAMAATTAGGSASPTATGREEDTSSGYLHSVYYGVDYTINNGHNIVLSYYYYTLF